MTESALFETHVNRSKTPTEPTVGRYAPFLVLLGILWASGTFATELTIPPLSGRSGETIQVPVVVDAIDHLAGVRLVIHYDPSILSYRKLSKSPRSESLMHVVNDKKPGRLIVVMAGARGVQGEALTIVVIDFAITRSIQKEQMTTLRITESQLMSDTFQEIAHRIKVHPLSLSPFAAK